MRYCHVIKKKGFYVHFLAEINLFHSTKLFFLRTENRMFNVLWYETNRNMLRLPYTEKPQKVKCEIVEVTGAEIVDQLHNNLKLIMYEMNYTKKIWINKYIKVFIYLWHQKLRVNISESNIIYIMTSFRMKSEIGVWSKEILHIRILIRLLQEKA
jgi:hypothetical protein